MSRTNEPLSHAVRLSGLSTLFVLACGGLTTVSTHDVPVGAEGGLDAAATDVVAPPAMCNVAADCAWGEINHEILKPADCVCLLGCPYIPLSKETAERRQAQYSQLCQPGKDGKGNPCPVDDCAGPPLIVCRGGTCAAPLLDGAAD